VKLIFFFCMYSSVQIRVLIFLASSYLCAGIKAQTSNHADVQFLLNLKSELSLDDEQFNTIDSLFYSAGLQITAIDKEIQSISRSNLDQEHRTNSIRDLNGKKKTIRESRDFSMMLLLNEEQKRIYSEKIKPAKPSVIHMGMNHDRANCNVCIP